MSEEINCKNGCGGTECLYHMLYDSVYMSCPERVNLERQIANLWWPGAGDESQDVEGKVGDC